MIYQDLRTGELDHAERHRHGKYHQSANFLSNCPTEEEKFEGHNITLTRVKFGTIPVRCSLFVLVINQC